MIKRRMFSLFQKISIKNNFIPPVISVLTGLSVGTVIIIVVALFDDKISFTSCYEAIKLLFFGFFNRGRDLSGNLIFGLSGTNAGELLFRATPIIMTGLSVSFAFRTGLFNIGTPGQYLMGTAATLITALTLAETMPDLPVWILAFISGILAGGLWGAVPGFLKSVFKVNEVLSGIMMNWIAANAVTAIFQNSTFRNNTMTGKTGYIIPTSAKGISTAKMGLDLLFPSSQVNAGIYIAIISAIVIYVFLFRTTYGFEHRICGSSPSAAEYTGINIKRKIIVSMAVAGSLSGAGAALYYLSGNTEFFWSTYQSLPSEGFNGIPVALLAANNPLGVIFSACFLSSLSIAGQQLKNFSAYNEFITDIVISIILYLSALSVFIRQLLLQKKKSRKEITQ